ncbi:MAG: DedA family protein [Paludibacteraceae bacterium]|nr:DedA family protein [Paludibacteraceae bacterium]MBQ2607990.1 DedA family protein [Paludibacteraceae bacterium]
MSLIDDLIAWYSVHMNYASITGLMAVESSFIPFPSEVVIPPAAFVAGQPESVLCTTGNYPMDVLIIVLFGTLGAMIGAIINYGLSVWLGRLIIYKFADSRLGHMCLLSSEKLERAEAYFREKGNVSTFVGRFIPGIRQLISIPAGLSRMHFGAFLWWTFLGAFIWNCILALIGYVAAGKMDLIKEYSHELSVAILILLGAVVLYFIVKRIIASTKR